MATSGYRLAGFQLGFGYQHQHITSQSNLLDGTNEQFGDSLDVYHASTARALPKSGFFQASAYRTTSDDVSLDSTSHNVSDDINVSLNEHVWRLPITGGVSYNDNVYGSLLQQLNSSGQIIVLPVNEPTTRILLTTVGSSYNFPHSIFVNGFVTRQEEYVAGQSYGATEFGGNVNYHFGRWFKGLSITVGANDSHRRRATTGLA